MFFLRLNPKFLLIEPQAFLGIGFLGIGGIEFLGIGGIEFLGIGGIGVRKTKMKNEKR